MKEEVLLTLKIFLVPLKQKCSQNLERELGDRKRVLSLRFKVVQNAGLNVVLHATSGVEPVCNTSFPLFSGLKNHRKTGIATQAKY
jgi:hypothetical protein